MSSDDKIQGRIYEVEEGERVLPLVRSFEGDERFEALFARWALKPHTARLQGGWEVRGMGRYSFLGIDPYLVLSSQGETIYRLIRDKIEVRTGNPFQALEREYNRLQGRFDLPEGSPPFQGGAIGYLGYGLRRFVEQVPARVADDLPTPDMYFAFYDVICVYDHLNDRGYVYSSGLPEEGTGAERRAARRLDQVWEWIMAAPARQGRPGSKPRLQPESLLAESHSALDKDAYVAAVNKAKAYIASGDIYQVNLAQRYAVPVSFEPDLLFDAVRSVNPSPFGAYIQGTDWTIISLSPERFFYYDGTHVETRPIKGTRPRGKTPVEDEQLRDELVASGKDRAEHVMIVDLERNDLGRFCEYSSVRVPELMTCEAHPTVWHLVSTIRGRPRAGFSLIEGVRLSFPGGSITGAPKVRAMEIIDELEPVARGVYTGSIGYLGIGNHVDLNIAIRTLTVAHGQAYFHVGGAIVADSDPDDEYQETLDKGTGIAKAIALASAWAVEGRSSG